MLRIIQSSSAGGAARYYTDGLKREDYYLSGEEVEGKWHGQALEKLGLAAGETDTRKQFTALLHNKHPKTGKLLTARMNAEQNRIPGWDAVFSVPKSVSLLQAVTGDREILRVFRESVRETMVEMETRVATRVRKDGRQEDRTTGNFAWAEFLHTTTRPLDDGVPDPHLHIHAYIFNVTFDNVEDRFKAAKIREIKDNGFYYEALHDSILARKLRELGYRITRTAKGWEIAGLENSPMLLKFSRRTEEIEKLAKELGTIDPKEKDRLGAKTRNRKKNSLSKDELVKQWKSRLTPEERNQVLGVFKRDRAHGSQSVTPSQAVEFALAKCFERESVVAKNRVIAAALKFGCGSVNPAQIESEMARRKFIERTIGGEKRVTTPGLVVEEALMIQRVRDGRGQLAPLLKGPIRFGQDFLSKEQREAVRHILKSNDQVIGLRGVAGSGKTTLLTEVRQQLEAQGTRIVALAPSAQASRGVLRDEGFKGANTIARFLVDKEMQRKARGHVLLVDEAGTIGIRDLTRLLEIAGNSTRVILCGDTGQHAPVARGDSLRILEQWAGLVVATVRQIRRQETEGYKKAVESMAEGDLKSAFSALDRINAFVEIQDAELRYRRVAVDYLNCLQQTGVPPLIVSPTHAEAREGMAAIRGYLRENGILGRDQAFVHFREMKWEAAEKVRAENYELGQMVQFHQNVPGIRRGTIARVVGVDASNKVWVETPAGKRQLDLARSEHFRVFEIGRIMLAPGDRVKITNSGKDLNGRRLENGTLGVIKSIDPKGRITLVNGLELGRDFGHIQYGYDTSHSSQGKTAREVFVLQSSSSFRAGSREQFYVSISRGKERLQVYTDDRVKLQAAVGNSARRMSALEFSGFGDEIFMKKGGLSGTEWTARIAKDNAARQKKLTSFVEKLAAQRKVDPPQGKIASFVDLVEMQRANVSPDGRSRSKGLPHKPKRPGNKGMPDPRGNEKSSKEDEKAEDRKVDLSPKKENGKSKPVVEGAEDLKPQQKPLSKKGKVFARVEAAVKSSNKHLKEVIGSTKRGAESLKEGAKKKIHFGKEQTTVGKVGNGQKAKAARLDQEVTKKPTPPKPKPPAPTIRKGK
jgi:conjugative relaxase-like TrwC/TraI family protein